MTNLNCVNSEYITHIRGAREVLCVPYGEQFRGGGLNSPIRSEALGRLPHTNFVVEPFKKKTIF